jgi:GNAT superfamily N-acetyltransferase
VTTIRSFNWPADAVQLAALDTSFVTRRRYQLTRLDLGFSLQPSALPSVFEKRYPLDAGRLVKSRASFVAEGPEGLVGVLALSYSEWNRRAVIDHLYVDRLARRGGVGTQLLQAARRVAQTWDARELWAETQNVNPEGIEFYRSRGFELCGVDTSFYDPLETREEVAVFLALPLANGPEHGKASGA